MYLAILILKAECMINGTRVAVNRDMIKSCFSNSNLNAYMANADGGTNVNARSLRYANACMAGA